jgi:hypothetical protein
MTEDCLYLKPKGIQTKRAIEAAYGIVMMDVPDQDTSFIKKVSYDINGTYPVGCNLAVYVAPDNQFVEMESMSPEQTLKPSSEIHWVEKWLLTEKSIGTEDVTTILHCLN